MSFIFVLIHFYSLFYELDERKRTRSELESPLEHKIQWFMNMHLTLVISGETEVLHVHCLSCKEVDKKIMGLLSKMRKPHPSLPPVSFHGYGAKLVCSLMIKWSLCIFIGISPICKIVVVTILGDIRLELSKRTTYHTQNWISMPVRHSDYCSLKRK